MSLVERIDEDLKSAMKAREMQKVSTLRMLKAAISSAAIAKGKNALEDAEVLEVARKMMKQHQESIEAFRKGGRPDLVAKEEGEAKILQAFLPPAMEEAELQGLVQSTIKELGVSGPSAMGQVMKAVVPKVNGRADNQRVSALVRQALGS